MAFATGLEGLIQLLPWGRRDMEEGVFYYEKKLPWFAWGFMTRRGRAYCWYVMIGLPSYSMKQAAWRWDGPPTWHKLHLCFKGEIPAGKEGWEFYDIEVYDD